jgi:hypothetical protein
MHIQETSVTVDNKSVCLRELSIESFEAVCSDFTQDQLASGHLRRLNNQVVAAAIVEIDGKPVDHASASPRSAFPLSRHWAILEAAYRSFLPTSNIPPSASGDRVEVTLRSGRRVTLQALSVDQEERIEIEGRYQPREWARALHDKVAASIVLVDGEPVLRPAFDARVSIPGAVDWSTLQEAFRALNQPESPADFLPVTRSSPGSSARWSSSAATATSPTTSSSAGSLPPTSAGS